jgi:hypothetical protein
MLCFSTQMIVILMSHLIGFIILKEQPVITCVLNHLYMCNDISTFIHPASVLHIDTIIAVVHNAY